MRLITRLTSASLVALPFALAGCPALLSDWTIRGSGVDDASADAPGPDAAGGGSGSGSGSSSGAADSGGGDATVRDGGSSSGSSSGGQASPDASPDASVSSDAHILEAGVDAAIAEAGRDSTASEGGNEAGLDATTSGVPPSCQASGAGLSNCGASSESCCATLEVSAGAYDRTYTSDADGGPVGEADPATVSGSRLDKYEVTVGRFRQFVNAWNGGSGYTPPAGSGKHRHLNGGQGLVNVGDDAGGAYETGWVPSDNSNIAPTDANLACPGLSTWTAATGSNETLPIDCVNWWEAYAFCIWDGGFLPSESEWEYAAAGGSQQREYPWGATAPGTGNQYAVYGCYYPNDSGSCTSVANIAPVGTVAQGAGLWGQLDLAGNVYEWDLDWFAAYVDPCADCANLTSASGARVMRGGDFTYNATNVLSSFRASYPPSGRSNGVGFRCARTP